MRPVFQRRDYSVNLNSDSNEIGNTFGRLFWISGQIILLLNNLCHYSAKHYESKLLPENWPRRFSHLGLWFHSYCHRPLRRTAATSVGDVQQQAVAAGLDLRASLKAWNTFSQLGHDMPSRSFQMFQGVLISLEVRWFKSSGHRRQPICQWNLKVNNFGDPEVLLYLYVKPLNREGLVIPAVLVSCWLFLFSLPLHHPSTHCEPPPGLFINSRFINLHPSRCCSKSIVIPLFKPFLLLLIHKIHLKAFCWSFENVNNEHISTFTAQPLESECCLYKDLN